jgi:hypothetical protein
LIGHRVHSRAQVADVLALGCVRARARAEAIEVVHWRKISAEAQS